ncbi:hypothetical protein ACXYUI_33005, partial [Klebsiella pneumoniae]
CSTLTEFRGVAELGIISGGGILLCAFAAFTILHVMLFYADRRREPQSLPTPLQGKTLRWMTSQHPWLVLAGSFGVFG